MHKLGHFVAGQKVGHIVGWDNLSPEKMPFVQWFSYIFAEDMAKNCPRYIQDMAEIRTSFAQGMGIQFEKMGQNVAGEGA